MKKKSSLSRIGAIYPVLLLAGSLLCPFVPGGGGMRGPGLDVSVLGFSNIKDLDDPGFQKPYPTGQTSVRVNVKNTGDTATSAFEVNIEVAYNDTNRTVFYADAEGASMPPGWTVRDFTTGRWHVTNRTCYSATHSAGCIGEGQAAIQYASNWEEALESAVSISVPTGSPVLNFRHRYATAVSQDGGYIEIKNGTGEWEREGPETWSFNTPGYNTVTAPINPISKDVPCFGGDSHGWLFTSADLSKYAGYSIKIRFVFSSSGTFISPDGVSGWYIDDVEVTNGIETPFKDDFESGLGKWTPRNLRTLDGPGGGVGTSWNVFTDTSPPYNLSSTKCFSNRNQTTNQYADGEDSALISPPIQLAGFTHARLYFQSKMQSAGACDGGFVELQSGAGEWVYLKPFMMEYGNTLDSGSPYGNIGGYSGMNPGGNWLRATFDLTPYVGTTVKIRFHFYAKEGSQRSQGWHIDEITVVAWKLVNKDQKKVQIQPMSVGASDTASAVFDLAQPGYYGLRATALLPGDTVPSNDISYLLIRVENDFSFRMELGTSMPVEIIHGRKGELGITLTNTGNTANEVNLTISNPPQAWMINLSKPNPIFLTSGSQISVRMDIFVPLAEKSGSYSFRLNGTSNRDPTRTEEREILVHVVNHPPTAVPGPKRTTRVYAPVMFDGSASSDPDGDELFFSWDFGDGTTATGMKVNHTYTRAGSYNVTLNVSDGGQGSWSVASTEVEVSDDAPIPIITIDTLPNNGTYQKGEPVVFNGTRSLDENPGLLQFDWDFGDGTEHGTGAVVEHVYIEGGKYDVILTVTDPAGHKGTSDPYRVVINNPPKAVISSPKDRAFFLTTDEIHFSANGSSDPDGDELTYEWRSNLMGALGTSRFFNMKINVTGTHIIQLMVYDGKGRSSYGIAMVTIDVSERTNNPPELSNGKVDPTEGDELITTFRYTVTYKDADNDMPLYVHLILDGISSSPHVMRAVDPLDTNCSDGKEYEFIVMPNTLLKGAVYPHNYSFETADGHGSGKVATETREGPLVKWLRDIRQDSWRPNVVLGHVYQAGPFRTPLNGVNVTPPPVPAGKLALDLCFVMNTTAPPELWYWANLTIRYSTLNFSRVNESTIRIYWSVDGGAWTPVPLQGLELESQQLWMNVSRANVRVAIFGDPIPVARPPSHREEGPSALMIYGSVAAVVVVLLAVVAVIVMRHRRPAAPPEPSYEEAYAPEKERVEAPAKPARTEKATPAPPVVPVTTTGEQVKIFRPATEQEVKVFRPAEAEEVKVFRPGGEGETEVKVFRPGGKEEEEEAGEGEAGEEKGEEGGTGEQGEPVREAGAEEREELRDSAGEGGAGPGEGTGTEEDQGKGREKKLPDDELDRMLEELK
ncbi:MAG: PKD domain-containing protein [Thermoplasmata archaeon]